MTTATITTEDLKAQLRDAQARQKDLIEESRTIDQQIQEAAKRAAHERAQAAREGGSLAHAAADLDVEHLRQRKAILPYELWAARMTTAQLSRDLHQAELEDAEAESRKAGEEFAAAQQEFAEKEKVRDEAYARHSGAGARVNRLRAAIREDARTLQELEEAPPRV